MGRSVRLQRPGGRREPPFLCVSLPRPDGVHCTVKAHAQELDQTRAPRVARSRGASVSSSSRRRRGRPARPAGPRTAPPPTRPWTWTSSCRPYPRHPTTRPSTPARPRPTPTGGSFRGGRDTAGWGGSRGGGGHARSRRSKRWQLLAAEQRVTGHRSRGPEMDAPTGSHGRPQEWPARWSQLHGAPTKCH